MKEDLQSSAFFVRLVRCRALLPGGWGGLHIGKPVIACERLCREGGSARWPASKGQGRARFSLCPAALIRDLPSLRRAFAYRRAGAVPL